MKTTNTFLRLVIAAMLMLPMIATGQTDEPDSVSYEGKHMKIEVVTVKTDTGFTTIFKSGANGSDSVDGKGGILDNLIVMNFQDKKEPEVVKTKFFVLDIGLNNLLNANNELQMPSDYKELKINSSRSVNFHWGIIQQGVRLGSSGKMRLVYGLGVEYNNYHFANDIKLLENKDQLTYELVDDINYNKNKVVTQYATIPLMLNYKSDPEKEGRSFNVAAGIQLGYLFRSHQKQVWEENGDKKKSKIRSDYNFEDYRYGYVVQFGYGNFNLYGKYYPEPAFRKNEGPEMNTVAMGIVLLPF